MLNNKNPINWFDYLEQEAENERRERQENRRDRFLEIISLEEQDNAGADLREMSD